MIGRIGRLRCRVVGVSLSWRLTGLFVLAGILVTGCAARWQIEDRPISFSAERHAASLEYWRCHYGGDPETLTIEPRVIVLHWTAIAGLEASFLAFDGERLPPSRMDLKDAGAVNVSIQFLVDRDGRTYRLMPETWLARHVIGLNHVAVGIENVGGAQGVDDLTPAQEKANIRLIRYLVAKYPTIGYLIGHHEYRCFEGHPLWGELDPAYRTEKSDPGDRFMQRIRRRVEDLELKGPVEIRAETGVETVSRGATLDQ